MTGVDLADEDAKFLQYLTDNGWEGEVGEDDDRALLAKGDKANLGTDEGGSEKVAFV